MRALRAGPMVLLLLAQTATAHDVETMVGSIAPPIQGAASADGQALTLQTIRGKVAMLWYESKSDEVQAINRGLKAEMKRFAEHRLVHPDDLIVVGIGDLSHIVWPFTAIARSRLRAASAQLGVPVYGDWDGAFLKAYRFVEDDSNFMLIDRHGIVRLQLHGRVDPNAFGGIDALLKRLVDEE